LVGPVITATRPFSPKSILCFPVFVVIPGARGPKVRREPGIQNHEPSDVPWFWIPGCRASAAPGMTRYARQFVFTSISFTGRSDFGGR